MSPSTGPARRSGDPRRRNAEPVPRSRADRTRVGAALAAAVLGAAVLTSALVSMQPEKDEATDVEARRHTVAACDLAGKAAEAAEATRAAGASTVDARSRYAAAVLLMDRAIIESARAAAFDPGLGDLDTALQELHTAGHAGDPDEWQAALEDGLTRCETVLE